MTLMIKWWKMIFFWSVQAIWDNFSLDASIEKFHSPSQEGGVSAQLPGGSVDDIDEQVLMYQVAPREVFKLSSSLSILIFDL